MANVHWVSDDGHVHVHWEATQHPRAQGGGEHGGQFVKGSGGGGGTEVTNMEPAPAASEAPVVSWSKQTVRIHGESRSMLSVAQQLIYLRKQQESGKSLREPKELENEIRLYERVLTKAGAPAFVTKREEPKAAPEPAPEEKPASSGTPDPDKKFKVRVGDYDIMYTGTTGLERLQKLYEYVNATANQSVREQVIQEKIAPLEAALKDNGFEVPKFEVVSQEKAAEGQVNAAAARVKERDDRVRTQLPKDQAGEIDVVSLSKTLGMDDSEVQAKLGSPGGPTQLYVAYSSAVEEQRRQEALTRIMEKRKAARSKTMAVKPAVTEAAKPISDLGVQLRSLGSTRLPPSYKDAGTTVPIGPMHRVASEGVAEALKNTPNLAEHVGFGMYEMPHAVMHAICMPQIGAVISMGSNAKPFKNPEFRPSNYTVSQDLPEGATQEERVRAYYQACTYHELGHVIDGAQGWAISREVTQILKSKFKTKAAISEWVSKNISPYAASLSDKRGWFEVPSELYAMKRLGKPIPEEFKDVQFDEKHAATRLSGSEFLVATDAAPPSFIIEDTFMSPQEVVAAIATGK